MEAPDSGTLIWEGFLLIIGDDYSAVPRHGASPDKLSLKAGSKNVYIIEQVCKLASMDSRPASPYS